MPYRIYINGFPQDAPSNEAAAVKRGAREAQKHNHVEVWRADSHGANFKMIKRWKKGKEVS